MRIALSVHPAIALSTVLSGHAEQPASLVLFSFSDRPFQEALQLFCEDRGHA